MSGNVLVAYYTRSGNTRTIANHIVDEVGGTICEIEPEVAYPRTDSAVVEQAKKEIQAGYKPRIRVQVDNLETYDTVFIGSPNWWGTIAPPVATLLSEHNLSGKTIVPFCTHGGGGQQRVMQDIARLCPHSTVLDGFVTCEAGAGRAEVSAWLRKIGMAPRT